MNAFKFFRHTYLCYFSQPVADRALYRLLRKTPVTTMVEIGLGQLVRTRRMLELALEKTPLEQLKYAGIDLFESRTDGKASVALKEAHKELKPFCGKLQLIPGDPFSALARSANALTKTDLVVISQDADAESLVKAWFYLPRMLHDRSQVFVEQPASKPGQTSFRLVPRLEVEQLASAAAKSMRRAA